MHDELARSLGEVFWSDLSAHAARDAIIVVADGLDILEAATAIASDDAARVAAWIEQRQLRKPSAAELAKWPRESIARFESIVVAPYVLVRPLLPVAPSAPN